MPKLFDAIGGEERDAETPISVVGAPAGSAARRSSSARPIFFLVLLGGLNVFIGVFNLFPLLPLDGGHVADRLVRAGPVLAGCPSRTG